MAHVRRWNKPCGPVPHRLGRSQGHFLRPLEGGSHPRRLSCDLLLLLTSFAVDEWCGAFRPRILPDGSLLFTGDRGTFPDGVAVVGDALFSEGQFCHASHPLTRSYPCEKWVAPFSTTVHLVGDVLPSEGASSIYCHPFIQFHCMKVKGNRPEAPRLGRGLGVDLILHGVPLITGFTSA